MDLIDRRVLGAVRFVDAATRNRIDTGLAVASTQATLRLNGHGLWVIWEATGLEAHAQQFEQPPAAPALGSVAVTLTVSDPAGRYLARTASVQLPLDPDPAHAGQPASLFQPIDVTLFRAANADASPGWAVIRAHVQNQATGAALAGVLFRVIRDRDNQVVARGMSDSRGEAMLVVPGIPVTTFNGGAGPPLATGVSVTVEAIFDPAAGDVANPDDIERQAGLPTARASVNVAARREIVMQFAVAVP